VLILASVSEALPTQLVVRAKSKDAKFIGTSMGGALVIVRDSESGEVLARGLTAGSTGSTQKIMTDPLRRGVQISDAAAAKFETTLDIAEPRLVTIEVRSPYSQRQSLTKNTAQVWLLPGKHITGDGVIIEVPGFVVDISSPQSPDLVRLSGGKATVSVKADVTMMCGCTLTPGGMWDSDAYEIAAAVKLDGAPLTTVPMKYSGKPSYFEAAVEITKSGFYEVTVFAYDPKTGNTGLDRTTFTAF
jgi:hypothetical protein